MVFHSRRYLLSFEFLSLLTTSFSVTAAWWYDHVQSESCLCFLKLPLAFFTKVADLIVRLMKRGFVWARTDKNRRKFHVNIYKACRYYYKNNLRSVKLPYPLKLFIRHVFWKYLFVFDFIEVNVWGQVKRAFELNALFLQIHSSGSLWLLSAVFVITDSSRGMDWPWCHCFVK